MPLARGEETRLYDELRSWKPRGRWLYVFETVGVGAIFGFLGLVLVGAVASLSLVLGVSAREVLIGIGVAGAALAGSVVALAIRLWEADRRIAALHSLIYARERVILSQIQNAKASDPEGAS